MVFQEAMDSVREHEQCSVLLGNGFSQAWNRDVFNYETLFSRANFGASNERIRRIFGSFGTYDFEKVMLRMLHAAAILEIYSGDEDLVSRIKEDSEFLKEALVQAIAETHPELPNEVDEAQYRNARAFLNRFDNIFSVNYDLLLYWARNKHDIELSDFDSDDGFRAGLRWEGYGTDQNVFFLHGGLHIYDTSTVIIKHAYTDDGLSIIEQVRANLQENKFPLFVSEPTYEGKLEKIEHNPYLQFGFVALRKLTGVLFIYGHSINESDKHIFDQINKSGVERIFVSLHGNPNSDDNQRTKANARAFMENPNRSVSFFDSDSAVVWNGLL